MSLLKYNNKKVKIIDYNGKRYIGIALFMDADTAEEPEDEIMMLVNNTWIGFSESDIKSIEVLKE